MDERADKPASPPPPGATRDKLVEAAGQEFNAHGFFGTDTNRIARRAGFAPQTFYRHFADKTDVFIAVYERWQADERRAIGAALRARPEGVAAETAIAAVAVEHHQAWRGFRRSLRLLAIEDARVRAARNAGRAAQLRALPSAPGTSYARRLAALLTLERLSDAAADDEIGDMGVELEDWLGILAEAIKFARG